MAKLVVFGGTRLNLADQALLARLHPSVEEIVVVAKLIPKLLGDCSKSRDILCASWDRRDELLRLAGQGFRNVFALRFEIRRGLVEVLKVSNGGFFSLYRSRIYPLYRTAKTRPVACLAVRKQS